MDRTTTHHNQDTTVPSLQNPPSRIPRPRGVTVRPWPRRPEFFENHSRPGGQRRPLLLPHPPHPPPPASLTHLHSAVHQLPPHSPFWALSASTCGAPRTLPRIYAHGVGGHTGKAAWGSPTNLAPSSLRAAGTSRRHRGCTPSAQVETL